MAHSEIINDVIQKMGDRLSSEELEGIDLNKVAEIVEAKTREGSHAYLRAHTSGDVILWPDEESSENDDGANAIARWQLDADTLSALYNWIDELA